MNLLKIQEDKIEKKISEILTIDRLILTQNLVRKFA